MPLSNQDADDPVAKAMAKFWTFGNIAMKKVAATALVLAMGLAGCKETASDISLRQPPIRTMRLAVTTSTRDSGLLDHLLPRFESKHSVNVEVLAVGTGAALKLGEAGDVDAVLVHDRDAEHAFMKNGHGGRREDVMYNRFQILGPTADPAAIRSLDVLEALRRIATTESVFVSRGDDSGTHRRESLLWQAAGTFPKKANYLETGQGMGPTLLIANEKQAYVLSDSGTAINLKEKLELVPLVDSGKRLENHYGVMTVNPSKSLDIANDLAEAFVDFLVSPEGQDAIASYRVRGQPLFFPAASGAPKHSRNVRPSPTSDTRD